MTGRLIDADTLIDCLRNDPLFGNIDQFGVIGVIEAQPTVDAEPVRHGKYIGTEFDGYADGCPVYYEWKCSECGCVFEKEEPTYNYCPNCGARMDGEDEQPSSDACDQISELVIERLKAEKILEQLGQNLGEVFGKIAETIDDYCNEILKEEGKKNG